MFAMQEKIVIVNGKRRRYRIEVIAVKNNCALYNTKAKYLSEMFPGGGMNLNESPEMAAIRETMEESGWIVKDPHILSNDGSWLYTGNDNWPGTTWDEELNIAVLCKADIYAPDTRFGDDSDQSVFYLKPIDAIISELKTHIMNAHNKHSVRDLLIAKIRLKALMQFTKPSFSRW